jgi:2-polyprenyl-3-methyl-5-hydroxy-6-metoxy-1,4-benzoquinol methylase
MSQIKGLISPFLEKQRMKIARRFVKKGSVLDVGCGEGKLLEYISEGLPYLGLDVDAACIQNATNIWKQRNNVEFRAVSLYEDPKVNQKFDNIVLLAVIEHMVNPDKYLNGLKDYLEADGRMIITTPGPFAEKILRFGSRLGLFDREAQKEHKKIFGRKDLYESAARAGLKVDYYSTFEFGLNQITVMVHG